MNARPIPVRLGHGKPERRLPGSKDAPDQVFPVFDVPETVAAPGNIEVVQCRAMRKIARPYRVVHRPPPSVSKSKACAQIQPGRGENQQQRDDEAALKPRLHAVGHDASTRALPGPKTGRRIAASREAAHSVICKFHVGRMSGSTIYNKTRRWFVFEVDLSSAYKACIMGMYSLPPEVFTSRGSTETVRPALGLVHEGIEPFCPEFDIGLARIGFPPGERDRAGEIEEPDRRLPGGAGQHPGSRRVAAEVEMRAGSAQFRSTRSSRYENRYRYRADMNRHCLKLIDSRGEAPGDRTGRTASVRREGRHKT